MIVESQDGYKWDVGGSETDDHLALGGHEPGLAPIIKSMCDSDKTYVNVGAHVGTWAIRMAEYSAHVIAIEANPLTAAKLQRNVDLNNLMNKVVVLRAAVWDNDDDWVHMVDVNGKATGGSTRAEVVDKLGEGVVPAATLDSLLAGVTNIGLISTDIEGGEARALRGATGILSNQRPRLLIELHEGHPGTDLDLREQVYAVLLDHDYEYHSVYISAWEEHILCYPAEATLDEMKPTR